MSAAARNPTSMAPYDATTGCSRRYPDSLVASGQGEQPPFGPRPCDTVPWIPAFAGMTFAGRGGLLTGVIPAEAGTQSTSPHARGPLRSPLHRSMCAAR